MEPVRFFPKFSRLETGGSFIPLAFCDCHGGSQLLVEESEGGRVIVLKGAPRLGAARRHPPAPRLKRGDAPSRRRRLGAQGARLQQGARRSPELPPTAQPGTISFSSSFFFFFFFFLFLQQSGCRDAPQP
ncbi:hypothetical protein CK203_082927 [Vitis vinifera]|uniref:Uncharacterized protein n=1 Tax=Vitis vinifera TaxID=29760 RepID=A0A438DEU1_VITVI|nr:hypothetical protein CK203_082927 [Vitis vinifera]